MTGRPLMIARGDGDEIALHPLRIDTETGTPTASPCPCGGTFMLAWLTDDAGERVRELPVLMHTAPPCEVFRTVHEFGRLWTFLNTGTLPAGAPPVLIGHVEAAPKPTKRHHR